MEWWQYLVVSIVTVCVGAFIGFWFNRHGVESERTATETREFEASIRAILAEVQANEKIANEPFTGRQLPFLTEMWNLYKPQTSKLAEVIAQPLHKLYIDIIRANTIVTYNLQRVPYGAGYLDSEYRGMCSKIANQAKEVADLLETWLKARTP